MSRSPRSTTRFVAILFSFLSALLLLSLHPSVFDAQAEGERDTTVESGQYQYPFQNPDLPIEERLNNLLSLMTLDEKIACLGTNPSVPRLGVKGSGHVEGIHGLAQGGPGKWGRPIVVPTTTFPQGIGMAETWDTNILRQAGAIEGYEARYVFQSSKYHQGGIVVRAPNADLGRDPRWGRTEECYGEDPYFNGTMAVAFIKGLQGDDPKYWQAAALLKHFLANSNENERDKSSSNFDERLLREYYSVPFRMGIEEGGARAFMAAYNAMNNIPMTVNPILKEIARKEWGEDGIICTDAGAMSLLVTGHKYSSDKEQAAAASIKAGITQFLDNYRDAITGALKSNLLTESDIDSAVKNNFRVMIRLGLLDPPSRVPYSKIGEASEPWLTDRHKSVARLITQESIVLLKNSNHLLPLDRSRLKSIAIIGPRADEVLLDWYSGTPPYVITPLQGIKSKLSTQVKINYAASNENGEAVNIARSSDVAIVCVGNHPTGGYNARWAQVSSPSEGREAVDRASITLEQEELIKQVSQANPNTVIVLISSFPYAINWTQTNVPAILHMTHNSQEEGNALADVLFGDYNPAGRLVQTWPRSIEQLPPMMDYDIRHGRTYMYFKNDPLYPFGYGLSYTTFAYSNLHTSSASLSQKGSLTVSLNVKNTGSRAGEEVVQMYVKHLNSAVARPIKELKGFARVALQPGETRTVAMKLRGSQLAYWDAGQHRFVVEQDKVQIMIGSSSADAKLNKIINVAQ
ncbi:MAG: beta-glucosidase [Acidobacteriota bacterium]|nr:beta-glucosidase [Acidobacteriota bacterium]